MTVLNYKKGFGTFYISNRDIENRDYVFLQPVFCSSFVVFIVVVKSMLPSIKIIKN